MTKLTDTQRIGIPDSFLTDQEEVLASARETLPSALYRDFKIEKRGTQKAVLSCSHGPLGVRRILKANMVDPSSQKGTHKVQAGYGVRHEFEIGQRLPEARDHGIDVPFELYIDGKRGLVFGVHDYVEGDTLEDRVRSNGPLSTRNARNLAKTLSSAVGYCRSKGVFHRDLNAANEMLAEDGKVKLTDFGVACQDTEVSEGAPYSLGGRALDPRLFSGMIKYDEQSEVHGVAESLAYGLFGKHVVAINPTRGTAVALDNGESLVGANGRIDQAKLSAAYERYLMGQLPGAQTAGAAANWLRGTALGKYAERHNVGGLVGKVLPTVKRTISRAEERLTPRGGLKRLARKAFAGEYETFAEFSDAVEKAVAPTLGEKAVKYWKPLVAGALTLGMVAGGSCALTQRTSQLTQEKVDTRYPVAVGVNGIGPEIDNSVIEFDIDSMYVPIPQKVQEETYPKVKLLKMKAGDPITLFVSASEKPWPRKERSSQPSYPGRAYFEGYPGKEFRFTPESFNKAYTAYEGTYNYGATWVSPFGVPTNMPSGIRNLVIELYSPGEDQDPNHSDARKEMILPPEGAIINRKVIPVQIGELPTTPVSISGIKLEGYMQSLEATQPGAPRYRGQIPTNLSYTVEVPEEGFKDKIERKWPGGNMDTPSFHLPQGTNMSERTLVLNLYDGTSQVQRTYCPIIREKVGDSFWWKFSTSDSNFCNRIQQYEKSN